jgi:lipopolysaccharide/colanic/teichoic acid biosynthesis glycosyltransferase
MIKRLIDLIAAATGLLLASPLLIPVMIAVWLQDYHSPFYIAPRVGRDGRLFPMVKLRSMVVNADKSGVDSTGAADKRITAVGRFIRRYKLDELTQLWNVLIGDMSLVGPRPNVKRETDLYTPVEQKLLTARPGITDFASIVFADEGDILADKPDPDLAYNQLIRPWKSRLGIFYVEHQNALLDLRLCILTVKAIANRNGALKSVSKLLQKLGAPTDLIRIANRVDPLVPLPPPGSNQVVMSRS